MLNYNDIDTDGITNITLDDVKYAAAMDSVIKLIGYAQFDENGKVYSIGITYGDKKQQSSCRC